MNIGFVGPIVKYNTNIITKLVNNNKPGASKKSLSLSSEISGIKTNGDRILKTMKVIPVLTVGELATINTIPAINSIGQLKIIIPRIKVIIIAHN
tara:strand:- start:2026 stop:2310 length:285 start_codon:yes stop_codon:yes gene_type:complete